MTSKERVMAVMNFQEPDRVPRYFSPFWPEFKSQWERVHGPTDLYEHFGDDMRLIAAEEAPWPSKAGIVDIHSERLMVRTGWGELKLASFTDIPGQVMVQLLEPAVKERVDTNTFEFEDPLMDSRFEEAGRQGPAARDSPLAESFPQHSLPRRPDSHQRD
jgi:hypothetical protein